MELFFRGTVCVPSLTNLIGLSTIFIFAFLIILVLVTKRIGKIQSQKRWLLPLTFGLYSGWLFIATVVNVSAWLVKIEWGRFGIAAEIWSVAILLVAVVLTVTVYCHLYESLQKQIHLQQE